MLLASGTCRAQGEDRSGQEYVHRLGEVDTPRVRWRAEIPPGERIDLVFHRSFLIIQNQIDTFPLNGASSGSYFLGVSANLLLAKRLRLRIQPGVNFYRLSYTQNDSRTFPSTADSLASEKLRSIFLQIPVGLSFVLMRNANTGASDATFELGISPGLHLGSTTKIGIEVNGRRAKAKLPAFDPITPLMVSAHLRLTYKFLGLYGAYRLTSFFRPNSTTEDGRVYPSVAPLELGACIQF